MLSGELPSEIIKSPHSLASSTFKSTVGKMGQLKASCSFPDHVAMELKLWTATGGRDGPSPLFLWPTFDPRDGR